MKINASSVAMTSSRSYQESTAVQTSSIIFKGKGSLGSAGTSKNKIGKDKSNRALSTPTQRLLDQLKQEERDRQSQTMFGNGLGTRQVGQREDLTESKESLEIEALRKLLEALRRKMESGFGAEAGRVERYFRAAFYDRAYSVECAESVGTTRK